jgi:outer membrane protein OmpA-like peptidoglycan-associated protein
MKKATIYLVTITFLGMTILSGCNAIKNTNKTQRGATIGAVGGGIIGGILGNNIGNGKNGALGAVLGAVIGGTVGGVIGNKMDKQAREIETVLPGAQVQRVGEGIRLVLGENAVNFDFNKSSLTTKAKQNLDKLVLVFKDYADTNIKIYGFTDSKGSDSYNVNLSNQRATAVKNYLVANGINLSRFSVVGMGKADPIATNETDEGRGLNRRVEFAILANEKMINEAKTETGN